MRLGSAIVLGALVLSGASGTASAGEKRRVASRDVALESISSKSGRARASRVGGGEEIAITVDPELQRAAARILAAAKAPSGAVVVSDVKTGRILAWVSHGTEGDLVRKAKYPGASLFKVVTTVALLEAGAVKPTDTVCYGGGETRLEAADIRPGCHPGDHRVRFDQALGKSLNGVFGRGAIKHLTPQKLSDAARLFGIGEAPPLDLPADKTSIVIPGDSLGFARAAAGFGDARMSPLEALFMMQTIANGGERVRLHVTGSPEAVPRVSLGRAFAPETASALTKMLVKTTRSGTSKKAFEPKEGRPAVTVAGKTGTLLYAKPRRLVSWFAGFAPAESPEIAVAVMLANDEKWWRKGNEVARDVFDAWFEAKKRRGPAKSP